MKWPWAKKTKKKLVVEDPDLFEVRIIHFTKDRYSVEYRHSSTAYKWTALKYWFDTSFTNNLEGWYTNLWSVEKAEIAANTLNSIEDVERYLEPSRVRREKFLKAKQAYLEKAIPFKVKRIR